MEDLDKPSQSTYSPYIEGEPRSMALTMNGPGKFHVISMIILNGSYLHARELYCIPSLSASPVGLKE